MAQSWSCGSEIAIKQKTKLKVDRSQIQKLFTKSDNTDYFQGNYLPQAL